MIFEQNSSLKKFAQYTPVTFGLIVAVTIMFLLTVVTGGFTWQNLLRLGALDTRLVYHQNEYWRLFTVMFLHADLMHYLFNTFFGLFLISSALERLIGSKKFALIYFLSGLGASAVIFLVSVITGQPSFGVGASGAIYGVLGALLFLTAYKSQWFHPKDISSIRGLIFINIIFTFLVPNISVSAHIGGLISGFLLTAIINPERYVRHRKKGFEDPYDPYAHEKKIRSDDPFDYIEIVDDDDDDDDRRVW